MHTNALLQHLPVIFKRHNNEIQLKWGHASKEFAKRECVTRNGGWGRTALMPACCLPGSIKECVRDQKEAVAHPLASGYAHQSPHNATWHGSPGEKEEKQTMTRAEKGQLERKLLGIKRTLCTSFFQKKINKGKKKDYILGILLSLESRRITNSCSFHLLRQIPLSQQCSYFST